MLDNSRTDQAGHAATVAAHNVLRPFARASEPYQAWRFAGLLGASFAIHVGLYWPFQQEPPALASVGEVSISVELVLGANKHAGLLPETGSATAASAAATATLKTTPAETAAEPANPVRVPAKAPAVIGTAAAPRPAPPIRAAKAETQHEQTIVRTIAPMEALPLPSQPAAVQAVSPALAGEIHASANPQPSNINPAPALDVSPVQIAHEIPRAPPAPERREVEKLPQTQPPTPLAPRDESAREVRRMQNSSAASAPASAAAGGVGRGRSEADENYRGRVAAHLARHKRFPPEAQRLGRTGRATVAFALDAAGRVTSVQLVRASGVSSFDGEATAMVRRASPFPRPPNGQGMSFTVPVSFRIN